ncbi:O-unit flippase-like protein [Holdemania massiliensis]|uniref:O-unit flippase-like protein n=1 Tax=Holdemania massiliensis TaxID=1468449 RepID=UPI001F066A75|nr:O-unit flippase-like protein [Holdemania massiliensis]MCH1940966.1 hypothetical protein [Holdemania massiliensis]
MQIRVRNRDIIWSYLGSFFQYCTSLIVLPMVLSNVSSGELGLWYTFASVGTLVTYLDFGFSTTLIRNITYAWSGAHKIRKEGFDASDVGDKPNVDFIKRILTACRIICLVVALVAVVVLATGGTFYIRYITRDFKGYTHLIAWGIYSVAIFLNLYYNYCGNALRGIGEISAYQKIIVVSRVVQIILSYIGILSGYALIALSTAYLVSGFVIRFLSNRVLHKRINEVMQEQNVEYKESTEEKLKETVSIFKDIWHNAKRSGVISLCSYATNQSLTLICSAYLGVEETAAYGLCLQIITAIVSVSGIMFSTVQPQMINQMATGKEDEYRKTFSLGISVFWIVSIGGMIAFGLLSKPILILIGSRTRIPMVMYTFMCLYMFLEHNHGEFTAHFTMRNRIVYLYPYIISSISILVLSLIGAMLGGNIYTLMGVHFVVQIAYNNWKWPRESMKQMHTTSIRILSEGVTEIKIVLKKMLGCLY